MIVKIYMCDYGQWGKQSKKVIKFDSSTDNRQVYGICYDAALKHFREHYDVDEVVFFREHPSEGMISILAIDRDFLEVV